MLVMEPDGRIEPHAHGLSVTGAADMALEQALVFSEELEHDIATQVRAMVDANLVVLAERLAAVTSTLNWSMVS